MLAITTRHHYPAATNLLWLNRLRFIAICGQGATVAIVRWGLDIALPVAVLGATIAFLLWVATLTWWRLAFSSRAVTEVELFIHLVIDMAALTVLLYWTGGWTNPFVSLYLLPVSVAANILPARFAWALTGLSLAAYSGLIIWHRPLSIDPHGTQGFWLHVVGMWFTFTISALFIAYFVTHMMKMLRERDRRLAEARENNLRNEQIIGIATLAASAAHELATPLSTVAVIARELGQEVSATGREELAILRGQIERCKTILQELRSAAIANPEAGTRAFSDILMELRERWQVLFPATELTLDIQPQLQQLVLQWDRTLSFALLNLLSNAAEVSPKEIALAVSADESRLVMDVLDRGPGLDDSIIGQACDYMVTTKGDRGQGLGLFLTNATIERFGGSVHLLEREGGGLIARAILPLKKLQTAEPQHNHA